MAIFNSYVSLPEGTVLVGGKHLQEAIVWSTLRRFHHKSSTNAGMVGWFTASPLEQCMAIRGTRYLWAWFHEENPCSWMIAAAHTHRIHGAAIYGNMDPINIHQMLAYIPAPWILWDIVSKVLKHMGPKATKYPNNFFDSDCFLLCAVCCRRVRLWFVDQSQFMLRY